jgi:hypothetical protein
MNERRGRDLEQWMTAAIATGEPALRSFVTGLRADQDAVTAGLSLPWSSGVVGGHVNRIKMLKRQMYGRASPDLLRRRVLLADLPRHERSLKLCQSLNLDPLAAPKCHAGSVFTCRRHPADREWRC